MKYIYFIMSDYGSERRIKYNDNIKFKKHIHKKKIEEKKKIN